MKQRSSMWIGGVFLLCTASCSKKVKEPEPTPVPKPAALVRPTPSRPVVTRVAQPEPPPEPPKIDPALVPVEEDFRKEAESKVDKRTNLEGALDRIAGELKSAKEAPKK